MNIIDMAIAVYIGCLMAAFTLLLIGAAIVKLEDWQRWKNRVTAPWPNPRADR